MKKRKENDESFKLCYINLDDASGRPYVQFTFNKSHRSKNIVTTGTTIKTVANQTQQALLRCDLHERAAQLVRDTQRAKEIFEEEKYTFIPPDEEEDQDDDDDDVPTDQQLEKPVPMA